MTQRAETEGQKRAVLDLIYQAWVANPELRLGQLIFNSSPGKCADSICDWLFDVEDFDLAGELEI